MPTKADILNNVLIQLTTERDRAKDEAAAKAKQVHNLLIDREADSFDATLLMGAASSLAAAQARYQAFQDAVRSVQNMIIG